MKNIISKLLVITLILLAATSAMALSNSKRVLLLFGGLTGTPASVLFNTDPVVTFNTDPDVTFGVENE